VNLATEIYAISERFPRSEVFGLTGQMRRAGVSIPANLAEGNCRLTTAAYLNHVQIALGYLGELRTLVEIAGRLKFVSPEDERRIDLKLDEVGRLIYGLRVALKKRLADNPRSM